MGDAPLIKLSDTSYNTTILIPYFEIETICVSGEYFFNFCNAICKIVTDTKDLRCLMCNMPQYMHNTTSI